MPYNKKNGALATHTSAPRTKQCQVITLSELDSNTNESVTQDNSIVLDELQAEQAAAVKEAESILSRQLQTFTPIFDNLIPTLELEILELEERETKAGGCAAQMTAALFGLVWRKTQGRYGFCNASQQTMADELRTSRRTIVRHLQRLLALGYISDRDPGLRNITHRYDVTDKGLAAVYRVADSCDKVHTDSCDKVHIEETEETFFNNNNKDNTKSKKLSKSKNPLLPQNDKHFMLFHMIQPEYAARGETCPNQFPSLALMRKFDKAAKSHNGSTAQALEKAIENVNQVTLKDVVRYFAKIKPQDKPDHSQEKRADSQGTVRPETNINGSKAPNFEPDPEPPAEIEETPAESFWFDVLDELMLIGGQGTEHYKINVFDPVEVISFEQDVLTIETTRYSGEWLTVHKHLAPIVRQALENVAGRPVAIEWTEAPA